MGGRSTFKLKGFVASVSSLSRHLKLIVDSGKPMKTSSYSKNIKDRYMLAAQSPPPPPSSKKFMFAKYFEIRPPEI